MPGNINIGTITAGEITSLNSTVNGELAVNGVATINKCLVSGMLQSNNHCYGKLYDFPCVLT